jgi:hypothetical protein
MPADGYGHIFVAEQLEDDIERLLAPSSVVSGGLDWMTAMLGEIERQTGRTDGDLILPRSWNTVSAADDWPSDRLPAVVIAAPGSNGDGIRDEDGTYTELWNVAVTIVVAARTKRVARRLAGAYAAAVRAAILQQLSSHSDNVEGVLAGQYVADALPTRDPERSDTIAAGQVTFRIVVPDVVTDTVSTVTPPTPVDDPAPDDVTVMTGGSQVTTTLV